ncbi:MAG: hypothetical protein HQL72_02255 [Magnetococcales bacterium]|nr:hypothetical protein [Magnetococcales bacterium]
MELKELGWLPVEVVEVTPTNTQNRNGQSINVQTDRVVVTELVRDMTAEEISSLENSKITAIKGEAGRRITARFPDWKQRNLIARGLELTRIGDANLTPEQSAEFQEIQSAWAWVESVRTKSGELEKSLPDDFTADHHWPA